MSSNWIGILGIATDISVVLIAFGALWVALSALGHQRNHDRLMAEPYVVWTFGTDEEGFVDIGLNNAGVGPARFIRSELIIKGQKVPQWNWQMVFVELGQKAGAKFEVRNHHTTMPKTIFSNSHIILTGIRFEDFPADELLQRLSNNLEIRYTYRSSLDKTELTTEWGSL